MNYANHLDQEIRYTCFTSRDIPVSLCYPLHYTWLDNQRSKDKIAYQQKHFGHCSFRINDLGKLEFDPEYYTKIKSLPPKLYSV